MNYPRPKFSKHLHYFLLSYGYCSICTTSAISGRSGIHTQQRCYHIFALATLNNSFVGKYVLQVILNNFHILICIPQLAKVTQIER